jgi:hypothetical protein
MMDEPSGQVEIVWENLLSRQPERIHQVYRSLSISERQAVLAHLLRMIDEPGWHPEQRLSARVAIQAIEENPPA